jgi:hypothetical protein
MISRDPDTHEGDDTRRLFLALKFNHSVRASASEKPAVAPE